MQLEQLLGKFKNNREAIEIIAGDSLKISKEKIASSGKEISVPDKKAKEIEKIMARYQNGTPLAYCLKNKYFFGYKFFVDENVLIPRPETEILVQRAIKIANKLNSAKIIDIGTGSGNIIISVYKNSSKKNKYFAVDKSNKALKVARKNANKLGGDKINFLKSNLLANKKLPKKFEIILANLPYLKSDYLKTLPEKLSKSLSFEPKNALDGGSDGLNEIISLVLSLNNRLSEKGVCLLEVGDNQAEKIIQFCKMNNLNAKTIKDLNNFDRFIEIRKKPRLA